MPLKHLLPARHDASAVTPNALVMGGLAMALVATHRKA